MSSAQSSAIEPGRPGGDEGPGDFRKPVAVRSTDHVVAYRLSLPVVGRRYYIACFVGREQRSLARLTAEKQRKSWLNLAISMSALAGILSTFFICTLASAYLVKSMLGIDLFEDHFFLHNLFFN